jgi:predicted dinucleotide-binding enzyme
MNIGILGTGSVGRTLATALAGAGHHVQMGTRDPEATLARTDPDRFGIPAISSWLSEHADVRLVDFAQAAAGADLVINATAGDVSLQALQAAGSDNLRGKVLLDVSNPLDFSAGFPPTLFVKETDSLGEQIQRAYPETMVVKSLNTMNAGLMLDPGLLSAPSAVFLSGDHADAKQVVADLLASFGWEQIIDLGGIATARGVEMLMPMWLQVMGVNGGPEFNWAIVT